MSNTGPSASWWWTRHCALGLAGLKVFDLRHAGGFGWHARWFAGLLQDLGLIIGLYLVLNWLPRRLPGTVRQIAATLQALALAGCVGLSAIYTPFLTDLATFPLDLAAVSPGLAVFFLRHFVGWSHILTIGLFAVLLVGTGIKRWPDLSARQGWDRFGIVVLSLAIMSVATPGPAASPLAYTLEAALERLIRPPSALGLERLRLPDDAPATRADHAGRPTPPTAAAPGPVSTRFLPLPAAPGTDVSTAANPMTDAVPQGRPPCDIGIEPVGMGAIAYEKVVVFVMESVRFADFASELADVSAIWPLAPDHWRVFRRYHTTNLDSFTSLLAMLSGVFVPFQAYVDEHRYRFVDDLPNLVSHLRDTGFATHFVTSFGPHQERFVPHRSNWTDLTFVPDVTADPRFVAVTSNPVEWAAEDLAVLDRVIEKLRAPGRRFVFQEMVYGHTSEWQAMTGIPTIPYYRAYFREFFARAADGGDLLDRTLVVITADHGPRDDPWQRENYRVPLLIWGRRQPLCLDDRFLSHLDFAGLLREALTGNPGPVSASETWVVGHSGEYIYGRLRPDGQSTFIANRTLTARSNEPAAAIRDGQLRFQEILDDFVRRGRHPDRPAAPGTP